MTRTRATAKQAGTRMETCAAHYLNDRIEGRDIERRRLTGAKDRGDLSGVKTLNGTDLAVEIKDHGGKVQVGPWLTEAAIEAANADAAAGIVIFKRRGISYDRPDEQAVLMTLSTLALLLDGGIYPETVTVQDPMTTQLRPQETNT